MTHLTRRDFLARLGLGLVAAALLDPADLLDRLAPRKLYVPGADLGGFRIVKVQGPIGMTGEVIAAHEGAFVRWAERELERQRAAIERRVLRTIGETEYVYDTPDVGSLRFRRSRKVPSNTLYVMPGVKLDRFGL